MPPPGIFNTRTTMDFVTPVFAIKTPDVVIVYEPHQVDIKYTISVRYIIEGCAYLKCPLCLLPSRKSSKVC